MGSPFPPGNFCEHGLDVILVLGLDDAAEGKEIAVDQAGMEQLEISLVSDTLLRATLRPVNTFGRELAQTALRVSDVEPIMKS